MSFGRGQNREKKRETKRRGMPAYTHYTNQLFNRQTGMERLIQRLIIEWRIEKERKRKRGNLILSIFFYFNLCCNIIIYKSSLVKGGGREHHHNSFCKRDSKME